jgi:hypothetical protein
LRVDHHPAQRQDRQLGRDLSRAAVFLFGNSFLPFWSMTGVIGLKFNNSSGILFLPERMSKVFVPSRCWHGGISRIVFYRMVAGQFTSEFGQEDSTTWIFFGRSFAVRAAENRSCIPQKRLG